MKIANLKVIVAKVAAVGVLAAAVVMAAPQKAQAQEVYVGVGGPYVRHGYYDPYAFRRHEEFERRQAYIRAEEYRRFRYDRYHRDGRRW